MTKLLVVLAALLISMPVAFAQKANADPTPEERCVAFFKTVASDLDTVVKIYRKLLEDQGIELTADGEVQFKRKMIADSTGRVFRHMPKHCVK